MGRNPAQRVAGASELPGDVELALAADLTKTGRAVMAKRMRQITEPGRRQRLQFALALGPDWTGSVDELVVAAKAPS